MHPVLLIARRKGPQDVLLSLSRVDRLLLSVAKRHQSIVGTVECLIPDSVARELVLHIGVYVKLILLEDLHTTSIVDLVLERGIHLRCVDSCGKLAA